MKNFVVIISCDAPASEEEYYFENSSKETIIEWWQSYYPSYMADNEWYAYDTWSEENKDYDEDFYSSHEYAEFYGSGNIEIIEITEENKEDFCIDEMEKII